MRTPPRLLQLVVALALLAGVVTACGTDTEDAFVVGYTDTPDMRAAAALYARAMERTGLPARLADAPAATQAELIDGVATGAIDMFPAFTGRLLDDLLPAPPADPAAQIVEVNRSLPQGVSAGDPTGVSDRVQLLVSADVLETTGVETLADCGRLPAGLPLVATGELGPLLTEALAVCRPGPVTVVASPAEAIERARSGQALAALTALEAAAVPDLDGVLALPAGDAEPAPPVQDLIPVFRTARIAKPQLKALSRIAGELTTADFAVLAQRVADGEDPTAVARGWLAGSSA